MLEIINSHQLFESDAVVTGQLLFVNSLTVLCYHLHDCGELIRQISNDRSAPGRYGVGRVINNVPLRKVSVPMPELSVLVQQLQIEKPSFLFSETVVTHLKAPGFEFQFSNVYNVWLRSVGPETIQRLGQLVGGQFLLDLQEIVQVGDDAVVGTRLASEEHWFLAHSLVNNSLGKHALVLDSENEGAEMVVLFGFAHVPHQAHLDVDESHVVEQVAHLLLNLIAIVSLHSLQNLDGGLNQPGRVLHHRDVYLDESLFRVVIGEQPDQFQVFD